MLFEFVSYFCWVWSVLWCMMQAHLCTHTVHRSEATQLFCMSEKLLWHNGSEESEWAAQMASPFRPSVNHVDSVENFDKIWTDQAAEDSPCGTPPAPDALSAAAAAFEVLLPLLRTPRSVCPGQ